MSNISYIQDQLQASIQLKQLVLKDTNLLQQIDEACKAILLALGAGNKILFCGNGGSFADAQHLAAELSCRFVTNRRALPGICLGTNSSYATAASNDFGFKHLFAREVEAIGNKGDVLVAITTSGNSENILAAIKAAEARKMSVIILTGKSGGKLPADQLLVNVPSNVTARIQEVHMLIGHIWCDAIDRHFT